MNRITPIVGVATDVLNMCHAVSNAAVKPFVVLGSKKPSLVRIEIISMVALLTGRERDWSLGHSKGI